MIYVLSLWPNVVQPKQFSMKTKFTDRLKLVALVFLVLMTCALFGQHDNINTIAGNGSKGFSGDGGPAMTAKLSSPHGAGFDDHGHRFIAGRDNSHIGMVDINTAVIATIAANGVDLRILTSDGLPQLSRTGIRSFVHLIFIAAGFVTGGIRIRVRLQARRTRGRYKTPSGAVSPTRKLPFLSNS